MKGVAVLPLLFLAIGAPAAAQDPLAGSPDLPREIAEELLSFLNDPATLRTSGQTRIPPGAVVHGDAGSLGGPYVVGGRIEGRLVVVNGDLVFEAGGEVTGDVTVAGGRVIGEEGARVGGTVTIYERMVPYTRRGDELVYRPTAGDPPRILSSDLPFGRARLTFRAASNYSRVEGLPVLFGPLLETWGRNPLVLEAFAVWRSISGLGLDRDEMGFRLGAEQSLGGRGEFALGATRHSEIVPIEEWGLSSVEASLATFLLRRDFRDYYERDGWTAFFRYTPEGLPVSLRAEFREEDHAFAPIRNPWALGDDAREWRPQPLAAEGDFRSVAASLSLDSRNDPHTPSEGWLVELSLRRGVGGDLRVPPVGDGVGGEVVPPPIDTDLTTAFLDVRRYLRASPRSRIALRTLAAGALTDRPLPPQLQHAVGGEGSLPGHARFRGDCGARATTFLRRGADPAPSFATYGCDRVALLQVEFQRSLELGWSPIPDPDDVGEQWEWLPFLEFQPRWSLFFDAGRGWALEEEPGTALIHRENSPLLADVGAGVFLGPLALYWAVPLTERERGLNFFVRLHHRF